MTTPWLAVLAVLCTACPAEMARVAVVMSGTGRGGAVVQARLEVWVRQVGLPIVYVLVAGLALAVSPRHSALLGPRPWAVALGLLAAPAIVIAEMAIGYAMLVAQGQRPSGISLHRAWGDAGRAAVAAAAVVAVCEEVIFRDLWPADLRALMSTGLAVPLALAAIVYALNHWHLGAMAVVQKAFAGVVYGGLFIVSGGLAAPLVAHVSQNVLVLLGGGRRR